MSKVGADSLAFTAARVKKLVQDNEEVGQVSKLALVAVNKSVEFFVAGLATAAATMCEQRAAADESGSGSGGGAATAGFASGPTSSARDGGGTRRKAPATSSPRVTSSDVVAAIRHNEARFGFLLPLVDQFVADEGSATGPTKVSRARGGASGVGSGGKNKRDRTTIADDDVDIGDLCVKASRGSTPSGVAEAAADADDATDEGGVMLSSAVLAVGAGAVWAAGPLEDDEYDE